MKSGQSLVNSPLYAEPPESGITRFNRLVTFINHLPFRISTWFVHDMTYNIQVRNQNGTDGVMSVAATGTGASYTFDLHNGAPVLKMVNSAWRHSGYNRVSPTNTHLADSIKGATLIGLFRFTASPAGTEMLAGRWDSGAGVRSYRLTRNASNQIGAEISANGSTVYSVYTTATYTENNFYLVTLRFKPSAYLEIWVNGVSEKNTVSPPGTIYASGSTGFSIGAEYNLSSPVGGLDWVFVSVYNGRLPDGYLNIIQDFCHDYIAA